MHFKNVCPLGCGLLHDEQQMEGGGAVAVGGAVVGLPSSSSSNLRVLIAQFLRAPSSPSFIAFVHHLRANSNDWSTPWP